MENGRDGPAAARSLGNFQMLRNTAVRKCSGMSLECLAHTNEVISV
jgi:hypothetical protein